MTMKRIFTGIVLYLACSWSAASQSAEPVGISTGTRVRVSVDNGPLVTGSVVRLTSQTMELADSRAAVHLMNTPNVTSLEVSRGRPVYGHRLAKGALKGFLILGGAATVVILASDPGYAFVGPLVFGPPGAVIGGMHANATRPEVWEMVPVSALAATREGSIPAAAMPGTASTTQPVAAKPGRGRQIAIGAAIGVAAGAVYASSNKSASPMGTKMVMIAIPAGLLGGAIGAFIH
jgi:hypothetical protein